MKNVPYIAAIWLLLALPQKASGAPRSYSGNGPVLSADAMALLKQVKKGSKISFSAKFKGPGPAGFMSTVISVE